MSLAARLAAEAEKQDLDAELALKLLDYYKAKSQARGPVEVPDVLDPKHPIHNHAPLCWRRYNTYLSCLNDNDGDGSHCKKQKFLAEASCPIAWIDEWKEQRAEGTFVGVNAPLEEDDE